MVCYGIFCSSRLPYRKITNKSMEISLTALEVVLFLLNNYFVLKSKDPVFKMGVYIMCFSLNRSFSKFTSHSEFLTPLEFVLFSKKSAICSFKCCYSSTRCAAAKQRMTTPMFLVFEVQRIDSNDQIL